MRCATLLLIALFTGVLFCCKSPYPNLEDGIYAEFKTSKGTMVARLFYEKTPATVANFVSLAEGKNTLVKDLYVNKKLYNGLIFHRVIDSFMIQGGDPEGTGKGNPGYKFIDEFHPDLKHDRPGIVSMANSGPNTNGSQFFITEVPTPWLDNKHTVFGELVEGMHIQDSISNVPVNEKKKPINDVVIHEINIIRKGINALKFDAPKVFLNQLKLEEVKEKKRELATQKLAEKIKFKHEDQKQNATKLPSGLQFFISEAGTGQQLNENTKVMTYYAVFLNDGTLVDTNNLATAEAIGQVNWLKKDSNGYRPLQANLSADSGMLSGFAEGLKQLRVGDKATLFLPSHLAYGAYGSYKIPPNTDIIFEVEVLELVK